MFLTKFINGLKLYFLKCLITPLLISFGVVLFVYVLFYPQISFASSVANMLSSYEPLTEKSIYNQVATPIVGTNAPEVEIKYPAFADKFAELSIERLGVKSVPVFNCDDYQQLNYGYGRSNFSRFPGEGGKIVLAGHLVNNKPLYSAKIGDEIVLKTNYGTFRYDVTKIYVVNEKDTTVMEPDDSKEQLVIYTCYPMYKIGHYSERLVVTSILKSGPIVKNIPFKDK